MNAFTKWWKSRFPNYSTNPYEVGRYVMTGATTKEAFRAGMLAAAGIAEGMGKDHGWNYNTPTMCGEVASKIRKAAEETAD